MVDARPGGGEVSSSTKVDSPPSADARRPGDSKIDTAAGVNAPDDMPSSKAPSKASSTRTSTPAAASLEDGQPLQTANGSPAPTEQALQSQPMSATASISSDTATKEPTEAPAAPYGTRSRNRPERKSRVNYAEDVEMDFELAPDPTIGNGNGNGSEPPSGGSAAAESGQSAGAGGKKGAGAGQGNASWGASGPNAKDIPPNANTPGTSTLTASPATTPASQPQPKRRKNAASHATTPNPANGAAPSQPGSRRAQNTVAAVASPRETNMLTFANSGACLKDGCLVADDGQTVAINGK